MRERLSVIDGLIANNRTQLQRLLELYLDGDFSKEILAESKARLESSSAALQRERDKLQRALETSVLSNDQIQTIEDLAAIVATGLDAAETDFSVRRRIIEMLDVQGVLSIEDGQKVVHLTSDVAGVAEARTLSVAPITRMGAGT